MRKLTKATMLGAAVAVAGLTLLPAAANAAEIVNPATLKPGATGTVQWGFRSTFGNNTDLEIGSSPTITFNAPANTTFTSQTTVPVTYNESVSTLSLTGCTLGTDASTLTCNVVLQGGKMDWPNNGRLEFAPTITVDADAPAGTYTGADTTLYLTNDTQGSPTAFNVAAALRVTVDSQPDAPVVDNIDNSSGSTVISGTGLPGATVDIMDAAGNVIGTTTVAADGTWSVDLGTDKSQNPENLTVTQSLNGETSDETPIDAADLPVINPAIAAGAGLALLGGAGAFLLRRKLA